MRGNRRAWLFCTVVLVFPLLLLAANRSGRAIAAGLSGLVELREMRGADRKFLRKPDGTVVARVYAGPVHYLDEFGGWQDIDGSIIPAADGSLRNAGNDFRVAFQPRASSAQAVQFEAGNRKLAFSVEGAAPGLPKVNGSRITYANVFPDVDLRYDVVPEGLKESVVLRRPVRDRFVFLLDPSNVDLVAATEGISVRDRTDGRQLFSISNLWMRDSSRNSAGEPAQSSRITLELIDEQGRLKAALAADKEWLNDPKRVYPVYIDPSITLDSSGDSYISNAYPSNNYNADWNDEGYYQLKCGHYSSATGTNYSLLKFPVSLPGAKVLSASLNVYCRHSYYATTSNAVWCSRITSSWTEGSVMWNNRPTSTPLTSTSVRRGQWAVFPATSCIQNWVNKTWTNYGFLLHENGNGATYWKKFNARENSSYTPFLEMSYAPRAECLRPISDTWLSSSAPTINWNYSGPTPQKKFRLQISRSGTVWDSTTLQADSGDVSSSDEAWTPPQDLPDGRHYWRIKVSDGYTWSSWANSSFRSDTTPPKVTIIAPADGVAVCGDVTVSAVSDDGSGSGIASLQLTDFGDALAQGTGSQMDYRWDTLNELNGPNQLQAIAADRVGNEGSSVELVADVENPDAAPTVAPYIKSWLTHAPVSADSTQVGVSTDYLSGEANARPSAGSSWTATSGLSEEIDLGASDVMGIQVGYAHVYVKPLTAQGAFLGLETESIADVWIDGERLLDATVPATDSQTEFRLEEGWNTLLIKLVGPTVRFKARITDEDGLDIGDLQFRLDDPSSGSLFSDNFNDSCSKNKWSLVGDCTIAAGSLSCAGGGFRSDYVLGQGSLAYSYQVDVGTEETSLPRTFIDFDVRGDDQHCLELGGGSPVRLFSTSNGVTRQIGPDVDLGSSQSHHVEIQRRGDWYAILLDGISALVETDTAHLDSGSVGGRNDSGAVKYDNVRIVAIPRVVPRVVEGRLSEAKTGIAVSGAEISGSPVEGSGDDTEAVTRTAVDGSFSIISDSGKDMSLLADSPTQSSTMVVVPSTSNRADIALQPSSGISGRVTDSAGNPIREAAVMAVSEEVQAPTKQTVTDINGRYSLSDVDAPNTYSVYVDAPGYRVEVDTGVAVPKTYYHITSTGTYGTSGPVEVQASLSQAASISGRVVDPYGNPLAGVTVLAETEDELSRRSTVTDEAGHYTLEDVDWPRQYRVAAVAEDGTESYAPMAVTVDGSADVAAGDVMLGLTPSFATGYLWETLDHKYQTHERWGVKACKLLHSARKNNSRRVHTLDETDPISGNRFWNTIAYGNTCADNGAYNILKHGMDPDTHLSYLNYTGSGTVAAFFVEKSNVEYDKRLGSDRRQFYSHVHNSYKYLGVALHAVQDLREPHHAALDPNYLITEPHAWYENWVRDHENGTATNKIIDTFASRAGHYNPTTAFGWVDRSAHTSYYCKCDEKTYYEWVDDSRDDYYYVRLLHVHPKYGSKTTDLLMSARQVSAGFIYGVLTRKIKGG